MKNKIKILIKKGVEFKNPDSVFIGDEVDVARISGSNVIIYPGTRIYGKKTLIMNGAKLGFEAPVTIDNMFIGSETNLKGGFFENSVFLGENSFGSGAHVRQGSILEEQAGAGHCVGLKHTILFPFVQLGSLINFCDCLMAGGTSRKNHSEVGSSFIHFNYTPYQDKATPSIFGNIYQGVMLNNKPIFLGGQGGIVGPCKFAFGTLQAAGTIYRKDEKRPDRLIFGGSLKQGSIKRKNNFPLDIKRKYINNCNYIAQLIALMNWYKYVRSLFVSDFFSKELYKGIKDILQMAINERIKKLEDFCFKLKKSRNYFLSKSKNEQSNIIIQYNSIIEKWNYVKETFIIETQCENSSNINNNEFLKHIKQSIKNNGKDYIKVIKNLDSVYADIGSLWLKNIKNQIMEKVII
ncbi:MAG: protein GlmU [Desulfobacteraceae bacterium 4572_130]|nr:MAG: protein GlmU [Desulfobacteraceae bacterium 4572_130]